MIKELINTFIDISSSNCEEIRIINIDINEYNENFIDLLFKSLNNNILLISSNKYKGLFSNNKLFITVHYSKEFSNNLTNVEIVFNSFFNISTAINYYNAIN